MVVHQVGSIKRNGLKELEVTLNHKQIHFTMVDIYNAPEKTVIVMCHNTQCVFGLNYNNRNFGDTTDKHGRYYEVGKEYMMTTEIVEPKADTNNQECILCWISFNEGYGSRFAVKGNIYDSDGKAYWPDFKDYFICPVAKVRDEKLDEIGI